jgi:ketosteroid isomerase-like protein
MKAETATGVVEMMLDHAASGRWEELEHVLADDFVIVEPQSLPYGGEHHGIAGYIALMKTIGDLFELAFAPEAVDAIDESTVLLRMRVTFAHRKSGRSVTLPVLELLRVHGGRVKRSEVYLGDTAALLETLA